MFYPAYKDNDTGIIRPLLFDNKGEPASVFWRSQSFIDIDYFTEELPMIRRCAIEPKYKEYFTVDITGYEDDAPSYIYELNYDTLVQEADYGVVSGYVPIEQAMIYYNAENRQEYLRWEMDAPIPAELYAELPEKERDKYVKFTAIDRYSKGYVCDVLLELLVNLWCPFEQGTSGCFLVVYSF